MRIGTWNVQGRCWTEGHSELVRRADCDVWLLTEIHRSVAVHCHVTTREMRTNVWWSGVTSKGRVRAPEVPHVGSAAAVIGGVTYCSSTLPYRGSGQDFAAFNGGNDAERLDAAINSVPQRPAGSLVWGGDWNHALAGDTSVNIRDGAERILSEVEARGLKVPTARMPHRKPGLMSVDHIAVPKSWRVQRVEHWPAEELSDHDAYVVEVVDV